MLNNRYNCGDSIRLLRFNSAKMTQIPRQTHSFNTSEHFERLSDCYSKLGHRQVVLVSGEVHWGWETIYNYTGSQNGFVLITNKTSVLEKIVSDRGIDISIIRPDKPSTMLGFNCSNAIIDCSTGFYPDALTSISGTIQPGGFLFIICPSLEAWPLAPDEFAKKRTSHGQSISPTISPSSPNTIKRFIQICIHQNAIIIQQEQPKKPNKSLTPSYLDQYKIKSSLDLTKELDCINSHWSMPDSATQEQLEVLAKIKSHILKYVSRIQETTRSLTVPHNHHLRDHPIDSKEFHIIQADRGRGKSHLMGLITDSLLGATKDNGIKFYITAPTRLSIQSVFNALADQKSTSKGTTESYTENTNILEFIAPERVLETVKAHDILLVDEAASLPLPLLTAWSNSINTILFATTTHGYEGTGKGFQIRFINHLKSLTSNIHQHELNHPIRYADNDPLEQLMFNCFCLNSEPKGLSLNKNDLINKSNNPDSDIKIECIQIHQKDLADQPHLLEELFSLLVQAHYQTRPSDLRDILDSPNIIYGLFLTIDNVTYLTSACLVSIEGDFSDKDISLINNIINGTRRPKGHLIPQVLTLHMGQANALKLKGGRVVRIATLPNLQSLNYGSKILQFACKHLKNNQFDYIGSSYADTPDVNGFWTKNDFEAVRKGNKLDKSSGTRSRLVLKGLSHTGVDLMSNCKNFYATQNKFYKCFSETSATEQALINIFINETGSYEAVKDILQRCENWGLFYNREFPKKASSEFRKLVKNWSHLRL